MSKTAKEPFTAEELCSVGISAIRAVLRQIIEDSENDPDSAFEPVKLGKRGKQALRIDMGAEDTLGRQIHRYKNHRYRSINILGEERLDDEHIDLTGRSGDWVLADAVDGTDLLERGLGNWCSAAVFYRPSNPVGQRIMAVVVGTPSGAVYYSSLNDPSVWVCHKKDSPRRVHGPTSTQSLENATICFYGQKVSGLKSIFRTRLVQGSEVMGFASLRFQTLAGIPMMLKLIDHRVRDARGIDIVLDVRGQKPHDVVPGAYLCLKAGAHLLDMKDGQPLTLAKLENSLMFPASKEHKLEYVIGANENLAVEIYALLTPHESTIPVRSAR